VSLEKLLKTAAKEKGVYADHLRHLRMFLAKHPELVTPFKNIVTTDNPIHIRELGQIDFKLKGLGLIKIDDNDNVQPGCELYRQYFKVRL